MDKIKVDATKASFTKPYCLFDKIDVEIIFLVFFHTGCGVDKYKPNVGNEKCKQCGKNAASSDGATSCSCKANYFREIGKELVAGADCYSMLYY